MFCLLVGHKRQVSFDTAISHYRKAKIILSTFYCMVFSLTKLFFGSDKKQVPSCFLSKSNSIATSSVCKIFMR